MRILNRLAIATALCAPLSSFSSQSGPQFPTHRFPTDESLHMSYHFGYLSTSTNFTQATGYKKILKTSTFNLLEHTFIPEFQPNRRLSVGGYFVVASGALNPGSGAGLSASKLGDQRIFLEYRFYDVVGTSIGSAIISKFPGYKNPTIKELADSQATSALLFGDAQIDVTALMTGEYWFTNAVRGRLDAGFTYRTENFSPEIPYMVAIGYANPRVDLDMRVRGNFALASSKPVSQDADLTKLKTAFADSNYAYADSPWTLIIQPTAEFWITPKIAVTFDYGYSLMGNNAPRFYQFGVGLSYREANTLRQPRRTFHDVDITTDQEAGQFPGEAQGRPETPSEAPSEEEFR